MSDYSNFVPTTEQVRRDYAIFLNEYTYSPTLEKAKAFREAGGGEGYFDRWYEEIIRKARAEGWAQGYKEGYADHKKKELYGIINNPYEEE